MRIDVINIIIISGYGLNCAIETKFAFEVASKCLGVNIVADIVHINELVSGFKKLEDYNIFVVPGGFSYGDDTGGGNALALRIKNNFYNQLEKFLQQDKLILGICNGCQALVRLLESFLDISLLPNVGGTYKCCWVNLQVESASSVWLQGIESLYVPIAHEEGNFQLSPETFKKLSANNAISMRYADENPNGSVGALAAISAFDGKVLAMMPHPERAIFNWQREDFFQLKERSLRQGDAMPDNGDGIQLFVNAIKHFR